MSDTAARRKASLALVAALSWVPAASAQMTTPRVSAPVPGQIVAARRIFISNAGSESYGSESYFRLTRYDGGPDRFYNQLYSAMKDWGRYELADSPAAADVVYEVRFTSPIVDQEPRHESESRHEPVYDPQLHLTLIDPGTRVALWSLTEHIQPARSRDGDNASFDRAVARILDETKLLAAGTAPAGDGGALTITALAPPGALEVARRQERGQHAEIGLLVGALGGSLFAVQMVRASCGGGIGCATPEGGATIRKGFAIGLGGAAAGALVGWLWPTQ